MNLLVMAAFTLFAQKIDNGYMIESKPIAKYETLAQCYSAGSAYPWNFPPDSISLGHAYYYRLVCLDHEPTLAKDVPANPWLLRP